MTHVAASLVSMIGVVSLGLVACGDDGRSATSAAGGVPAITTTPASATTTTTTTTTTATTATTTTRPRPATTTAPTTTTTAPQPRALGLGDTGADVEALERSLARLGYWPGVEDDRFDDSTQHAVVALQKAAGAAPDGIAGPAVRAALADEVVPSVRDGAGLHVEVHLDEQLLVVVRDGSIEVVLDTSTGARPGTTPVGTWTVTREIDALHRSALGLLYRPKYFVRGVAVHGYTSVPSRPASHGCVRVTYPAMDLIWERDLMPIGTPVVVR